MDTSRDVRGELRAQTSHLTMETPVESILARGDRLGRRRRRAVAGGVVAAAAVGAVGVLGTSVMAPPGSSPLVPEARAAWGPAMVNLPAPEAGETGRECARHVRDLGADLAPGADPVAADTRGGQTVAVYRAGGSYALCTLREEARRGTRLRSAVVGRWDGLRPGADVGLIGLTAASDDPDAPTRDVAGALRVGPGVEQVTVDVDGQVLDAAVGGGVAMFWLPDGLTSPELADVRATAYDADGTELSTTTPF
ncbi:hypothetical protein AB0N29_12355 [Nocardioides sp. NPDC092400]|uniref:hypothetical protein n=1 Tax=Nocardioides sp. NPDC092400 TaxID=3155196 RepID=UPI0034203501